MSIDPIPEAPPTKPPTRITYKGMLWFLVILAVIVGGSLWFSRGDGDNAAANQAASACRDFVKDRLKTPSTAKFSNEEWSKSGDRFTITAAVDAENSFGATVRSNYTCEVRLVGSTWKLVNLTGLE